MKSFECNGCGACCRRVKDISPNWPTREDGACIQLTADNRCAIYANRPLVCRVDDARPQSLTVETWHKMNADACARLQREEAK